MQTIKAFILEDELQSLNTLHNMLAEFCPQVHVQRTGSSIIDGLRLLSDPAQHPDLVFLDVNLADGLVFQLLEQLPEKKFDIIFVSGRGDLAADASWLSPIAFLVKPLDPHKLISAVERIKLNDLDLDERLKYVAQAVGTKLTQNSFLPVATSKGTDYLTFEEIIRIDADKSYSIFVLRDGRKIMVSKNIGEYEFLLQETDFIFRIHKSTIVNLLHVNRITSQNNGSITLSNGDTVKVSRRRWDKFVVAMNNYHKL